MTDQRGLLVIFDNIIRCCAGVCDQVYTCRYKTCSLIGDLYISNDIWNHTRLMLPEYSSKIQLPGAISSARICICFWMRCEKMFIWTLLFCNSWEDWILKHVLLFLEDLWLSMISLKAKLIYLWIRRFVTNRFETWNCSFIWT